MRWSRGKVGKCGTHSSWARADRRSWQIRLHCLVFSLAWHILCAAEEEEPQGLAALLPGRQQEKRVNIKERMASILMQVRTMHLISPAFFVSDWKVPALSKQKTVGITSAEPGPGQGSKKTTLVSFRLWFAGPRGRLGGSAVGFGLVLTWDLHHRQRQPRKTGSHLSSL